MKVILLEDVYKKGVAGEVVDVAPGYARNYLIPKGLAVKVTPGTLRQMETLRKQAEVRRAEREQEFSKIAGQIENLTLYFSVKAGEKGKLYGSVTPAEIAERLQEELGLEIDRRRVGNRPLRELGEFQVPVRLDTGLTPTVRVILFREGEDPRLVAEAEEEEEATEEEAAEAVEQEQEEEAPAEEVAAEGEEAAGAELPDEEPVEE